MVVYEGDSIVKRQFKSGGYSFGKFNDSIVPPSVVILRQTPHPAIFYKNYNIYISELRKTITLSYQYTCRNILGLIDVLRSGTQDPMAVPNALL
jgi:hypothetical protein